MVQCKFFLQGCCRYGDSCRFEHSYSQKYSYHAPQAQQQAYQQHPQQVPDSNSSHITAEQLINLVVPEVSVALKSKQWLLSCYGPFKNKLNFPGFNDISPEELRLSAYEAQSNGSLPEYLNQLRMMQQNVMKNFQALLKPSSRIINTIQCLYKGELTGDPFDTPSYGNFMSSDNTPQSPDNLFRSAVQGTNTSSGGNIFNTAPNAFPTSSESAFSTTSTNVFANNLFAAAAQAGSAQNSNNAFGVGQNNDPFQQQGSPQKSIFSTNGSSSGMFGAPSNPTNFSFGQPAASASEVSSANLFPTANSGINQAVGSVQGNLFVNSAMTAAKTQQNPFEMPSTNTSNIFEIIKLAEPTFGRQAVAQGDNYTVYSKPENLSEDELALFSNKTFQHGFIPEIAPPFSLCT